MNRQLTVTSCIVASSVENEQNEKVQLQCMLMYIACKYSFFLGRATCKYLQTFSFQHVISDQYDAPAIIYWHQLQALSCNELSACQLPRGDLLSLQDLCFHVVQVALVPTRLVSEVLCGLTHDAHDVGKR